MDIGNRELGLDRNQRLRRARRQEARPAALVAPEPPKTDSVSISAEAREMDRDLMAGEMSSRSEFNRGMADFAGGPSAAEAKPAASAPAAAPTPAEAPAPNQATSGGFVDSLYDGLLGRDADAGGKEFWQGSLDSGKLSSSDLVKQFVGGEEFKGHDLDSEDKVELLYETILGREADAGGLDFFSKKAEEKGINAVIDDLFASDEFKARENAGQVQSRFAPEPAPPAAPTPAPAPAPAPSAAPVSAESTSPEPPSILSDRAFQEANGIDPNQLQIDANTAAYADADAGGAGVILNPTVDLQGQEVTQEAISEAVEAAAERTDPDRPRGGAVGAGRADEHQRTDPDRPRGGAAAGQINSDRASSSDGTSHDWRWARHHQFIPA